MQTREEILLDTAVSQFVHQGRWPEVSRFRVDHEHERDVLDQLVRRGLLRHKDYAYAVTVEGLAAVGSPEALDLRNQTRSMLGLLKERYRENPAGPWPADELRRLARDRGVHFFEQTIELLVPAATIGSADKDGNAIAVSINETILDVADDIFPPLQSAEPSGENRSAALIQSLNPKGFLSFGPASEPIALGPLNVIIGPNGSGKSNLLEALALLQAAPTSLSAFFRRGSSAEEWLHRADGKTGAEASVEVVSGASLTSGAGARGLRYRFAFGIEGVRRVVTDERLESASTWPGQRRPYLFFGYEAGRPMFNVARGPRMLQREDVKPEESVLSQRADGRSYPEIAALAGRFRRIRLYRDWVLGPDAPVRHAPRADDPADRLEEDCSNLPLVVDRLKRGPTWPRLIEELRHFYPPVADLEVSPAAGRAQLYFVESSGRMPASRMSDGTLKYLCMLAVLFDPDPPALLGLEEPELGMHPDMLPRLARLLREASERMQVVVTTHSELFVDAFTGTPEVVLVCERGEGGTTLRRLEPQSLTEWLKQYAGLGDLWMRGFLGGTRW